MHMSDALLSTPVALAGAGLAAVLIGVAGNKIKKNDDSSLVPLMGVMGAFVFAAQMVNFSIPGTGSSGHIVGGVLLAALLGPWAGFLTLASVLIIQCLIFSDGGLMALGWNIINMGAITTLIAYPLIYKPIARASTKPWRLAAASVAACVAGLELGAVMVTVETWLSGITALPFLGFLGLMSAIHLAIGLGEGIATSAVLVFVAKSRPDLLVPASAAVHSGKKGVKKAVIWFAVAALVVAGGLSFLASSDPDGLEWSIGRLTGGVELETAGNAIAEGAENIRQTTALMPDYESSFSGVVGAVMVVALVWAVCSVITSRRKKVTVKDEQA